LFPKYKIHKKHSREHRNYVLPSAAITNEMHYLL
jgi:hypothetical protein